ncbi:MAG: COX15/CtaA family protein [Spirosomataceae bacterium]
MTRKFYYLSILAITSLYLLIFIGGIVRATGSGMGCPDWPKCFGLWVPPTDVSELPPNYEEIFGQKLKGQVEFNVYKTWTEYLNRLAGVIVGLIILGTAVAAWFIHRKNSVKIWYASLVGLIMVIFQGWLGSKVVSNELLPVMVTLHMIVALLMVYVYNYIYVLAKKENEYVMFIELNNQAQFIVKILLILTGLQIVIGTQVREIVDSLALYTDIPRAEWSANLGSIFYVHALVAVGIVGLSFYLYKSMSTPNNEVPRTVKWVFYLALLEFLTGLILYFFEISSFAQPFHLTVSTIILGFLSILLIRSKL